MGKFDACRRLVSYESFDAVDHLVEKGEPVDTDFLFFQNVFASVSHEKL